ncbi:hypothetical protein [Mycobacteroides abscessus]|nr:hypothetical protein [Mycobacteroides abscessus]CPW71534.1 Uncharacterised protein [Mycobacteroides abscessus]SKF62115.1 Uncharacterised protein [Mycobacteroides abscessus subsp. bolletii]SKH91786.1 Uncharacterised protein [Mycobacteroides abscessus subsp. bolletii]
MTALLNQFDRPVSDGPVTGGRDAQGRSFLDIAREQVVVEADTLELLAER